MTDLVKKIAALRAGIVDEIGQHHFRKSKVYPTVPLEIRLYFVPHQSATENRTFKSHGKFHAADAVKAANGGWLGRAWPGTAYALGASAKYGIIQAWSMETMTYHCGYEGNPSSVGGMLEGHFDKREPTDYELLLMIAMKIEADHQCGRRLIIKYHDQWKPGWGCPGGLWPKIEFARLEAQYYIDITIKEDDPEETPTQPEPEEPQQDEEDPASYPRSNEPAGCLTALTTLFRRK